MARPLNITITESREELERRLQHETDARQQERLQMLYWLKRGLVKDSSRDCPSAESQRLNGHPVAQRLSRRWTSPVIRDQTAPGAARVIPPEVMDPSESAFSGTDGISEL